MDQNSRHSSTYQKYASGILNFDNVWNIEQPHGYILHEQSTKFIIMKCTNNTWLIGAIIIILASKYLGVHGTQKKASRILNVICKFLDS